ncbi:MAG: hypothetical protein KBB24_07605 [Bacteroidales bacterium]|jgi:hypothetical protein|nr:hypothetical protein [Bacteroidales bacterium]MDX9925772.1 hypothetical protein [Bacteroidales bacterium]HNX85222.1 hypothetical protein [Bacteroidales bacterium]HOC04116.1 hypothetical protein [Bacteroidales bacterium]HPS98866.1 hypothetical protein [Bacteroidales bacterium]
MSGRLICTKLAGILSLVTLSGSAQTGKDTLRVLFVGNSYTCYENLPQVVMETVGSKVTSEAMPW